MNLMCYEWGPEVGGFAHLQSQGEGEANNPHRPVPQGFEPWTSGSEVQYSTPDPPAPKWQRSNGWSLGLGKTGSLPWKHVQLYCIVLY